jgi:hypothetical protein
MCCGFSGSQTARTQATLCSFRTEIDKVKSKVGEHDKARLEGVFAKAAQVVDGASRPATSVISAQLEG